MLYVAILLVMQMCSSRNRESFMNVLADIWEEWATPEMLVKAAKRVGISNTGLNVDWMDQTKFAQAEAILNPSPLLTPTKDKESTNTLDSPVGVRKGSVTYLEYKLAGSEKRRRRLENTVPDQEAVPGLLPFKTVVPMKTKNVTDSGAWILKSKRNIEDCRRTC